MNHDDHEESGAMNHLLSRIAFASILAGAFAAAAPAASAQTSITVDHQGGNMLRSRFTVQLRDDQGAPSGKAIVDHPGMGIAAQVGTVPLANVQALEAAVQAADLLNQAGEEWTGGNPDVGQATYTDQDGNYTILHPMFGPNGIDETPEMTALAQAMSDARSAFTVGSPTPAAAPFLSYTYGGGWIGQLTLDVLTDGSCHLHGVGMRFNGIDMNGQLSASQLDSLRTYMSKRASIWANYPTMFGRLVPDGTYESITYTDDNGNAKTVERWMNTPAKPTWNTLERFLKGEAQAIDPNLTF
jgi:hypothetical protein